MFHGGICKALLCTTDKIILKQINLGRKGKCKWKFKLWKLAKL